MEEQIMAGEIQFGNTAKALAGMADAVVKAAQNNLQSVAHNPSGRLAESIEALPPKIDGAQISIQVQSLSYAAYINQGVRGTRGGSGAFMFKNDFPGTGMIKALQSWIVSNNITPQRKPTIHARAGNNGNTLRAAFAIGRSVLRKGIQPTGFFDKAVQTAMQQSTQQVAQAGKTDIINTLKNNIA